MPSIPLVGPPIPQNTPANAVRVDPNMYAAEAAAGRQLGGAIAGIGEEGIGIQTRIKKAKDYAAMTDANSAMDDAFNQFQVELNDPNNPENGDQTTWKPRWDEKLAGLREQLGTDPRLKGLSPEARIHFQTQITDFSRKTGTQLDKQAVVRSLEAAKGSVINDYNTKLRTGDVEGAKAALSNAVPYGIIHAEEAQTLIAGAERKADHYQASALIMQDPIAAEDALSETNKDGAPKEFTHLDDDARLQLTFEARRRAAQVKSDTASDLFERQQAGTPAGPDEVNDLVARGRLSPAQAKQYLKPPKPDFEPSVFAHLISDISAYDPAKDPDHSQYAALFQRAAYSSDLKGPAGGEAVELLKKKFDPKSPQNTPVARAVLQRMQEDRNENGIFIPQGVNPGKEGFMGFGVKPSTPYTVTGGLKNLREMTDENVKTYYGKDATARQVIAAEQIQYAKQLTKMTTWLENNPKATEEEAELYRQTLTQPYVISAAKQALAAPSQSQFHAGERRRQNGTTYEYDGKTWKSVK